MGLSGPQSPPESADLCRALHPPGTSSKCLGTWPFPAQNGLSFRAQESWHPRLSRAPGIQDEVQQVQDSGQKTHWAAPGSSGETSGQKRRVRVGTAQHGGCSRCHGQMLLLRQTQPFPWRRMLGIIVDTGGAPPQQPRAW